MLGIINQTSTKMPANMFSEVNATQVHEDHRALQLAFELSVLRMNGEDEVPNLASSTIDAETRKRSANMTECVPVPSSEHVAEIVGRQGEFRVNFIHSYKHETTRKSLFIGHARLSRDIFRLHV